MALANVRFNRYLVRRRVTTAGMFQGLPACGFKLYPVVTHRVTPGRRSAAGDAGGFNPHPVVTHRVTAAGISATPKGLSFNPHPVVTLRVTSGLPPSSIAAGRFNGASSVRDGGQRQKQDKR